MGTQKMAYVCMCVWQATAAAPHFTPPKIALDHFSLETHSNGIMLKPGMCGMNAAQNHLEAPLEMLLFGSKGG